MNIIEKWKTLWGKLPREIRVALWVALSGVITAVIDYLTQIEANALTLALVNIVLVMVQSRAGQVKTLITGK